MPRNRAGVFSEISQISTHIFISDLERATNFKLLKKKKIKTILYIGNNDKENGILMKYEKRQIKHHRYNLFDDTNADISTIFDKCYNIIHKSIRSGKNILIHCSQGVSRSSTVVINYYLRRLHLLHR